MSLLIVLLAVGLAIAASPFMRVAAFRYSVPSGPPRGLECPRCGHPIAGSGAPWHRYRWLWVGRCRVCGVRVGPPLATVEVGAVISLVPLAAVVDELVLLLAYSWLALVGVTLMVIDSAVHRLPDRLTALLAAGTAVALGTQTIISHEVGRLVGSLAAGAGAAAFYVLMALLTRDGIGLGDAKLAFGLGLSVGWMGWPAVAAALFLALLLTGLAAVALLALGRAGRKDAIPHGPFMVIAAIVVVVALHAGLLDAM